MSNVVNLHRSKGKSVKELMEEAEESGYSSFVIIGLPENVYEDDSCYVWSNFEAGVLEITAVDIIKDYLSCELD